MAPNHDLPATDSAAVLHELVGDDATAAFENDPKFIESNPGDASSSNNLQTRADRNDIRSQADLETRNAAAADDDDDDEDEDLDDEDEDDLEDDDEDDDDEDDEDDEDLDDEDEDEDDDEYEDDDDEDDEDDDEDDE